MVSAPRQFAARFLEDQERPGDFAEHRMERDPRFLALQPVDRRLAQELVLGVLRWRSTLDWLIGQKTDGRSMKPALRRLLQLGLYQLFWLDRIPDHAVVHDAVALARQTGYPVQAGFINAVLRGFLRERDSTRERLRALRQEDPARGWSFPSWLVERWSKGLTPDQLQHVCQWNNSPPPTFARVNRLQTTPMALSEAWTQEGVEHEPREFDWTEQGLVFELKSFPSLATLPSFQRGDFYVQDPSTLLAVQELDPRPGEEVLDLCAAPGGKTTYIAQRMDNRGRVVAHDPWEGRLRLVSDNCRRLGVSCVEPIDRLPEEGPVFDRILVDAPCSNTGVLRRRVELRWRLDPAEFSRLAEVQSSLLDQAARRLKPGGSLVYSTCSLEPEENQEVVSRFLERNPGYRLVSNRSLTPLQDGVDGAFVARLRGPG